MHPDSSLPTYFFSHFSHFYIAMLATDDEFSGEFSE